MTWHTAAAIAPATPLAQGLAEFYRWYAQWSVSRNPGQVS